eukprot:Gb_24473 [translate_table: standard]
MGERSGSSGDSYIGSLISLTSKSEIRYEGILYTVDTEKSNIALQDVRSFGTEGRKKDGPQIPPSDKVYDYIIFRGSDIKDLQVKSSPPAQTASQLHSDPAIISLQSQYSRPASASTPFVPSGGGPLSDMNSQGAYSGVLPSPFRGGMPPMYQAGANLGSWGRPPSPPGANGMGLGMPMYWQGYYRPPGGIPHIQQQPMPFQPHPGMPPPLAHLPQLQHSSVPSSLPMGLSPSLPFTNSLQPPVTTVSNSSSSPVVSASVPVDSIASFVSTTTISDTEPIPSLSSVSLSTAVSSGNILTSSKQEVSVIVTPASSKPRTMTGSSPASQAVSQPGSSLVGPSSLNLSTSEAPTLVTPGQLLHPVGFTSSLKSQSSVEEHKVTAVSNAMSQPLIPRPPHSQPQTVPSQPLLPLPTSSSQHKPTQQLSSSARNTGVSRRGRGRGRGGGVPHGAAQFTEDFDFIAMNEKFKKDEVWGQLGKGESKDKLEDGEEEETADGNVEDEGSLGQSSKSIPDSSRKPMYTKDDFFDSISCDALDRGGRSERTKFSEQRKIDTQTFGSFPLRSRVGRGNRGSGFRGNFRGSYYGGRGNGYGGRGRGGGHTTL